MARIRCRGQLVRWLSIGFLISAALVIAQPALADVTGNTTTKGSRLEVLTRSGLEALAAEQLAPPPEPPWYRYASSSACPGARPGGGGADDLCSTAVLLCAGNTPEQGLGPAVYVFRREVDALGDPVAGAAGNWDRWRYTCLPQLVPGASNALTVEMIQDAFSDTDFTVPTVNIQPEGDLTLVNLPTFFEARFPESGYGPGEIDEVDPARMLGHRVEVRPVLKSITYHLGDQTLGPTTSLGGPYPNGDVRATYARPGTHEVRADIVYTGQFRVGGSDWFDIPGEVDLTGTAVTLTVAEAKSRLVTN